MTARVREAAAVSAVAVLLTLAIAAPVLRAPSDRIFGMEIVGRHHDPFSVMEQFGRGIHTVANLVPGIYSQPLTDVAGALLARASGPVAAYNWLVLLSFPLSAAAAYLLARYLRLSPIAAALAAIAFAFSPFHLAHAAYHAHIAQTQWIPLYFLALWRCLDEATPVRVACLAISIVAVTLSNFYGGLIAAAITPPAVIAYWFVKTRSDPASGRRLAITICALVAIAGVGITYARYAAGPVFANPAAFGFPRSDLFRYSAKWWSYLVPPVGHPLLGGFAQRVWTTAGVRAGLLEQQVSLGWGVVALGLVAVAAWARRSGQPASLAFVPVVALVAAAALLCSLSPERTIGGFTFVRPSAFLYRLVPMFRSYARFGVVVQLMAVLLAAIGAECLWRSGQTRAKVACIALVAVAAGEYAVWPPALSRDVLPTTAHRWVARQAARMNVLDCSPLTPESASIQWLTGYRISLGHDSFADCTEPHFADKLSAAGYTHLLVRRDTSTERWFATERTIEGLQAAARFDDGEVFTVTAAPQPVYTTAMASFYAREYDDRWTWRWMGRDASWTIVNKTNRMLVASVAIEMTPFHRPRGLRVLLDGSEAQTMIVDTYGMDRIGPLTLTPGDHLLVFHPTDAPTVADDVNHNGDRRPLSFALGTWEWTVEGPHE